MPGKGSPEFIDLMNRCIETHYKKNHDYASESNPFQNFERTAIIVSWFSKPIDQVFATLVGTKLSRIAELANGTVPANESLDDSFMDGTNYFGLWGAYHIKSRKIADFKSSYEVGSAKGAITEDMLSGTFCGNSFKIETKLPQICIQCNTYKLNWENVAHAIHHHNAIWNHVQKTLKYPNGQLQLLDNSYLNG
jgi:hypothetical protein